MTGLTWLKRLGPCNIQTRPRGDWQIVEVRGRFAAGSPEVEFLRQIDALLESGVRRVVVDLSGSLMADNTVAGAASEAFHRARAHGADLRIVVQPGRAGGYYHMAGLEMTIPTFARVDDALVN